MEPNTFTNPLDVPDPAIRLTEPPLSTDDPATIFTDPPAPETVPPVPA